MGHLLPSLVAKLFYVVRVCLNTSGGGGIWSVTQKKWQRPFAKKSTIPWACKKHSTTPFKLIFHISKFNCFHENSLFMTFVTNVCQWGLKKCHPLQGMKQIHTHPSLVQLFNTPTPAPTPQFSRVHIKHKSTSHKLHHPHTEYDIY